MEFKRLECMDGWLNGWRQCWHVERLGQKTQPSIESIKVIVSTHITYDFHSLYCFYVNIRLINARKMLGKYLYSLIYHQNVNPNEKKKHTHTHWMILQKMSFLLAWRLCVCIFCHSIGISKSNQAILLLCFHWGYHGIWSITWLFHIYFDILVKG